MLPHHELWLARTGGRTTFGLSGVPIARFATRQHEVSGIRAGDEQNERNGGKQNDERQACASTQLHLQGNGGKTQSFIEIGISLLQAAGQDTRFCLRSFE